MNQNSDKKVKLFLNNCLNKIRDKKGVCLIFEYNKSDDH